VGGLPARQETDKSGSAIHELLKDIKRNRTRHRQARTFAHALAGWWSRRIDRNTAWVYRVTGQGICWRNRYHYESEPI